MRINKIENLLEKAANNSIYRPEFYDELLKSELIVLYQPDNQNKLENGLIHLKKDTKVKIRQFEREDGKSLIPIFTSVEALQKGLKSEESYLQFNAKSLFEITKGAYYILNPYSDYAKEFTPKEIDNLLNDIVPQDNTHVLEKEMKILVGQPKDYPHQLVNALKKYFFKTKDIQSAYLIQVFIQDKDKVPHLMVAINMPAHNEKILRNAIAVSEPFLKKSEYIDFMVVKDNDSLVSGVQPFFRKTLLNRFKNAIIGSFMGH